MFTGLVEEVATVEQVQISNQSAHLRLRAEKVLEGVQLGDSIAVNGVCLTVVAYNSHGFTVDAVPETMRRTNLGKLAAGDAVNLERALQVNARLGGHIVAGHVDGVGVLRRRVVEGIGNMLTIEAPLDIMRYVVAKGSICVNGVSLTVVDATATDFRVEIIPHTGKETTLLRASIGSPLNLESDVLAKYVERLLMFPRSSEQTPPVESPQGKLSAAFLAQHGFA